MIFPWYFHAIPMIFPCYSHDIPMIFPCYFHAIPMIFPWFSHDFPMVFPWYFHDHDLWGGCDSPRVQRLRRWAAKVVATPGDSFGDSTSGYWGVSLQGWWLSGDFHKLRWWFMVYDGKQTHGKWWFLPWKMMVNWWFMVIDLGKLWWDLGKSTLTMENHHFYWVNPL